MSDKLRNKSSITEQLAEFIAMKLNKRLLKEGIELKKMKLGLEILLINISKFFILFIAAYYFNLLKEVILMSIVFASIRKNAFGLHSNNSVVCTIASLLIFIFGAYGSYYLILNNYEVFVRFFMINLLIFRYSPGDTENHPILGKKLRDKLRKKSVLTGIFLMLTALIIPSNSIKAMIIIAVGAEVISILPITYKILNRGYKNYEKYERAII